MEFCAWLPGRRVVRQTTTDEDEITLVFDNGTSCRMVSAKSDATPGYSECTPGSDGHLLPPRVFVTEGER